MRFGPVALDDAGGAYLAHSVRVATAGKPRIFKKGRRLGADDIAALRAAGIAQVIAARLDPGDVHEDEAARRLAEACAGEGLAVTAPFTGRCNLVAEGRGLLLLDAARVDRINQLDEAITIATLPAFDAVEPRRMAATVKIIPLAADGAALQRAIAIAGEGGALARLARFVPTRAALIQTRIDGMKESILDNTVAVTRDRLAAADSSLIEPDLRCAHDAAALAAALDQALAAGPDIVLIAGASAIVDRRDTLPAAIEAAGGRIEHFGMPVDPGNLMLVGALTRTDRDVPVLGLPGCARSPKLNGFDWVLQRLIARVPVRRTDIMAMGVGGLLKEIASRPQPRDKAVEESEAAVVKAPHAPRIAAVVLAAGQSRRMGAENKLLAPLDGVAMVRRVAETVCASGVSEVVAVTGHEHAAVADALAGLPVKLVHNPDFAQGLSTSVRTGLGIVSAEADGALVQLGDMPDIRSDTLDRLIAAFNPAEGRAICIPTFNGRRGNPVLWGRRFFDDLAQVRGDSGGRQILADYAELICEVGTDDPGILMDVDTPEALAAIRRRSA
ncbi:MAG: molybdopterin-binding/glycosyltransferase family 2 protein [Alphaproteobacteria bacterium]